MDAFESTDNVLEITHGRTLLGRVKQVETSPSSKFLPHHPLHKKSTTQDTDPILPGRDSIGRSTSNLEVHWRGRIVATGSRQNKGEEDDDDGIWFRIAAPKGKDSGDPRPDATAALEAATVRCSNGGRGRNRVCTVHDASGAETHKLAFGATPGVQHVYVMGRGRNGTSVFEAKIARAWAVHSSLWLFEPRLEQHNAERWVFEKMPVLRRPIDREGYWDDSRPQSSWFRKTHGTGNGSSVSAGQDEPQGSENQGDDQRVPSVWKHGPLLHPAVLLLCCGFVSLDDQMERQKMDSIKQELVDNTIGRETASRIRNYLLF
eukprot:CAMPEP_0113301704 /NCGR_PEP_ID=MMETSP0010_2-20120614/2818_1 /TAXON_ID=216773 ORGANISM="Corethron hystrix, Strain 308" /NCGR_SAMPLE_ID=MMETSP0010_2 /ASSEMBLY_ACC=CAM_ASM_000155 /LENGTH=317 /DNA_ID=CAMNT_0000155363 /DNA_START=33 /DNA_END=986 /DNA_ORIENTATION=+ /assembly_acc=CAM_ASM_000155